MADPGNRRSVSDRKNLGFRPACCCSFTPSKSFEDVASSTYHPLSLPPKLKPPPSPISATKLGLGLASKILSPGRVLPICSDDAAAAAPLFCYDPLPPLPPSAQPPTSHSAAVLCDAAEVEVVGNDDDGEFDLRLDLKGGRSGRVLSLELDSEVLRSNSGLFAGKIVEARRRSAPGELCVISVEDIGDFEAFSEAIELMYEKDLMKRLMKIGVSRAIDVLEVSSTIMFDLGVKSCLKYLEAVPWCESEEEKLKSLFARFTFNEVLAKDILARLSIQNHISQPLGLHIIRSVTQGEDANAKKELKPLVKSLLSRSSVYQKDHAGINKEDLYRICGTCLQSLLGCFKAAYEQVPSDQVVKSHSRRPLLGQISEQVDNVNWLLEILIDGQMAEDFVGLWANQTELLRIHQKASPMVKYELSRVSASLFIALGRGKVLCCGKERCSVFQSWFSPMLTDFGWLRRCTKGLDLRELEECMGHVLLTLPLKQQQILFMEWFEFFSGHGQECPNLSRAFQVWWRRTFF